MRAHTSLGKSLAGILLAGVAAAGCTTAQQPASKVVSDATKPRNAAHAAQSTKVTFNYTAKDRECLKRAMYFESEHSDRDGYMPTPAHSQFEELEVIGKGADIDAFAEYERE